MVQQYHEALNRSNQINREALENLREFCINGVRELFEKRYETAIYLGSVGVFGGIDDYVFRYGDVYKGVYRIPMHREPHIPRPDEERVKFEDIPFNEFDDVTLLMLAESLELLTTTSSR